MTAHPLTLGNPERELGSVAYILTRSAEIHPDRVAIDDRANGLRISYRELEDYSNQLARLLIELEIGKGDLVATMFANEANSVSMLFALAKIGAVVCPINVRLLPEEVKAYLESHSPAAIVCSSNFCDRFREVACRNRMVFGSEPNREWKGIEKAAAALPKTALAPVTTLSDPFRMIPTGGTTGISKGVVHSHGGTLMTILTNIAEFGIRRGWKTILIAPAYHGAGMDWGLFPILWRGGTVIMPPDASFNPKQYIEIIRAESVEFALLVPATIGPLYSVWDGNSIDCVKTLISTSAPTAPAMREKLAEMFPKAELLAGAGISESLNMAIQSPSDFLAFPTGIGEPHLDTRLQIVDQEGRELARGKRGEICLRGFNTALYYHANPDASAKVWRKREADAEGLEWCFTGDIGVMDSEGRVEIVDRTKDIILTGGETVPSVEIENAFAGHFLIKECAAVGLPDPKWGEIVTLVVVKSQNEATDHAVAQELFSVARSRLAGFKAPKQIVFINALPRSHFGKPLKRELREMQFQEVHLPESARTLTTTS